MRSTYAIGGAWESDSCVASDLEYAMITQVAAYLRGRPRERRVVSSGDCGAR